MIQVIQSVAIQLLIVLPYKFFFISVNIIVISLSFLILVESPLF